MEKTDFVEVKEDFRQFSFVSDYLIMFKSYRDQLRISVAIDILNNNYVKGFK